jgi:hypothetical protein
MAGCGYVCAKCEGKGFLENLEPCDFCQITLPKSKVIEIKDEDWIKTVHNGSCCWDNSDSTVEEKPLNV